MLDNPTYEIDYVSQLAQAQRRSELNSLVTALTMTGQVGTILPEINDGVDPDKTRDEIWGITGAPVKVLRSDDEIQAIRENRGQQNAKLQEMQMLNAGADTYNKAATGDKSLAQAKKEGKVE
jgi:hypothetical protein